ncbi:unnamed protein product [Bursaphelenchus xylophilus]|uniref:UDP-N-acetylglucosamine diphosphorylase n=1 Tax=Bursaphelenchus xylophilus TaxID=6326 RepID=A0A7I8WS49_BURXY|nr:unnamed protein product [Bursaphelenchus xylophilus]CAG9115131.1 unnamed protein product [Bursaphelenchus xylophilus]
MKWVVLSIMDFNFKVNEDFKKLDDSTVVPGLVLYEDGDYVYHKPTNEVKSYDQIPKDRYLVKPEYANEREKMKDQAKGMEAISKGELCVLVLCGGQATRLGADRPKGTFELGLEKPFNTLLRYQAAQIVRLKELAKNRYPSSDPKILWYIMVSKSTHKAIKEHIDDLCTDLDFPRDDIVIFEQQEIPAFSFEGKKFLQKDGTYFMAPNGNGGLYDSLRPHLSELESSGVRYVHVYCVDNILCRVGDPIFLSKFIEKEADCAAKVVEKKVPSEKVGVICLENGKPTVVEYTELPKELAAERTDDGKLKYRAGSIANHLFSLDFLKEACQLHLPYHIARKKIPFYDPVMDMVFHKTINRENGVKLERFIFDVFPASKNFLVFQVERSDEFSPLKNPDSAGVDCPSTCRRDLSNLHAKWLQQAGIILEKEILFISPLRTYDGEGLSSEETAVSAGGYFDFFLKH